MTNRTLIRTFAVLSLASAVVVGSARAERMYNNQLAGSSTVPPGTYGNTIVVPDLGLMATGYSVRTALAEDNSNNFDGIVKKINGDNDIQTHTVSGWFKVDNLNQMIYFAQGVKNSTHSGYKVWVDEDGHVCVAKTLAANGSTTDGTTLTTSETIVAGTWYYLTVSISRTNYAGNSRRALVQVFINGTPCTMSTGVINTNLNGNGGCDLYIESGVEAAGLYVDTEAVTESDKIIAWATDSNLVQVLLPQITVTLDAQGGSGGDEAVTVRCGELLPPISVPTKEGFRFVGYFDEDGLKYYNGDGTGAKPWDKAENATLTAQWRDASDRSLPSGYEVLDGIRSTAAQQYIDTEYVHKANTRIDCEFCVDGGQPKYKAVFGAASGSWHYNAFFFGSVWDNDRTCYCRSDNQAQGDYITAYERINLTCERDTAVWNGRTITTSGTLDDGVNTMFIFAWNGANGSGKNARDFCKMQLYSFKISEDGTLMRDYVACVNDQGEVGLYDLVNERFCGSANSEAFIAVYPPSAVTLDAQGGSGGEETVTVRCGEALPEIVPPTREGYVFAGYFSSAKGGKQYYTFDGNGKVWDRKESATLYAQWWAEGEYRPTQIYNGDFTKTPWMDFDFKGTRWTLAGYDHAFWSTENVVIGGETIKYGNAVPETIYFNGVNQGWNTTEIQTVSGCMFEYYCPEWGCGQMNPNILVSDRFVEMNANNPAILYQDLTTQAGDIIRWSLKHGVRTEGVSTTKDRYQTMRVEIGAPLRDENGVIVNATGTGSDINPNIVADTKAVYRSSGVTDADGNVSAIGFGGSDLDNLYLDMSSKGNGWWSASGVYIVPGGQDVTRFGFISEAERPSLGNLLDDIVFSTLLGNLHLMDNGDGSATIFGYWGDEDVTKRLAVKIGNAVHHLEMSDYVNQNFSIVLPAEKVGEGREVTVYHEDYPSAARTLRFSPFYTFVANGGAFADGTTSLRWPEKTGEKCSLPEYPTRVGYSATGWFTAADGGTEIKRETTVGDEALTLYTHWQALPEVNYEVDVKQVDGDATAKQITVSRTWLDTNLPGVDVDKPAAVKAALEEVDSATGLKKWHEYVLGVEPGDTSAKIWIGSPQQASADRIKVKTREFTPTVDCGFTVKYRLDTELKGQAKTQGALVNSPDFDVDVTQGDPTGLYTVNVVFVPEGAENSGEMVRSVNTMGILKVPSQKALEIVAVPWNRLAPDENQSVLVADLVKTATLTPGDKLHVYDKAKKTYKSWSYDDETGWVALGTYKVTAAGLEQTLAPDPAEQTVARGSAVWLERQDASKPFYLYGQYSSSEVATKVTKNQHNLVASPKMTAFRLNDAGGFEGTISTNDQIIVPQGRDKPPKTYTYKAGQGWGYSKFENGRFRFCTTDDEVPVGTGFWYVSKGGEPTIRW